MLRIDNVLFPTDFSSSAESAFGHAAYLAHRHDAVLHIVNVVEGQVQSETDTGPGDGWHVSEQQVASDLHTMLEEGSGSASGEASPMISVEDLDIVQVKVQDVAAPDGILRYAEERDIDLVAMGTHGRRGADRLLLGSVAEEVVRLAPCPVLTVRADEEASRRRNVRRILMPVDFSEHSRLALSYAAALADTYAAQLHLLHVVEEYELPGVYGVGAAPFAGENVEERAGEAMQNMVREEMDPDGVQMQVRFGYPPVDIVEVAEKNDIDLIVTATHGRKGLKRVIMGSVAERVIRMAPCPVFTVKSFGKLLISGAYSQQTAADR